MYVADFKSTVGTGDDRAAIAFDGTLEHNDGANDRIVGVHSGDDGAGNASRLWNVSALSVGLFLRRRGSVELVGCWEACCADSAWTS